MADSRSLAILKLRQRFGIDRARATDVVDRAMASGRLYRLMQLAGDGQPVLYGLSRAAERDIWQYARWQGSALDKAGVL